MSNRNAVYGALATMAFSYRFTVFQTRDSDETAQLIAMVAKHGRYGNLRYASPIVRGKPSASTSQRQSIVARRMAERLDWAAKRSTFKEDYEDVCALLELLGTRL